jgi:predicted aldo/keto reductase-like oxidoreductase
MQLGFALKHFPRDSYILQTKVAPQKDPKEFRKVFEKSIKYLQHDYVELFSLHGINNRDLMEYALCPGGCLEEAYKLKEEGRVKHIGFSTHASNTEITEIIERGNFDYVNLHWYLIAQLNGPSIEAAAKKDMGVFIISPNDKGGRLYNPPQKMVDLCDPLEPMAFNDLFCWANPNVHTISCGAARPSDFDTHVKALEHYDEAESVIASTLEKIYAEVARVGGPDWHDTWHTGLPEWDTVPGEINVKDVVRLWTWAKALDLKDFAKWRYNMLGTADHWFPGHIVKDYDEKKMHEALRNSPHAEKVSNILKDSRILFENTPFPRLSKS